MSRERLSFLFHFSLPTSFDLSFFTFTLSLKTYFSLSFFSFTFPLLLISHLSPFFLLLPGRFPAVGVVGISRRFTPSFCSNISSSMDNFVFPPRFFKVFISHLSSDSMLIPIAYYDELPRELPKTAILQGPGGRSWNVEMKIKQREVYFEQGWAKFVADNNLRDGEFLTFVYNRDRIFEVSIYRCDGYKEIQAVTEEDKEKSVHSLSSEDTDDCSDTEMENTTILECRDKGKSKIDVVEDSDDEEDSVDSLSRGDTDADSDTCSEFKMAKTIPKSRNKGKKKVIDVESSDEELESDYSEAFDCLDCEESSYSDDSYAPDNEGTITFVKPKVLNPKKKGETMAAKKKKKVDPMIKTPETYLDNPKNVYFETNIKNRLYELLIHAQLVNDYCLRFGDSVDYIDRFGILNAETTKWLDQRVCIKKWNLICKRNELKKEDRVLCELLRKKNYVYAIKLHIIRGENI